MSLTRKDEGTKNRTTGKKMTATLSLTSAVFLVSGLTVAILFAAASAQSANAATGSSTTTTNNIVFPPSSTVGGLTYQVWSAKWWQWVISQPAATNPVLDTTGAQCKNGQPSGSVWFLAGTFGGAAERTCYVPSGKALFFPLYNSACLSGTFNSDGTFTIHYPEKTPKPVSVEQQCAAAGLGTVSNLQATLDGVSIPNLDKYRVQSSIFRVTIPAGDITGLGPATGKAASDGYWLMLTPLSTGTHNLHFAVTTTFPDGSTNAVDVTYHLVVG